MFFFWVGWPIVELFTGFLVFYFLFDFVIRFFMQAFPVLSVMPYLTMRIKRNTLLHYVLIRSTFHFLNLLGVVLIAPFFFKVILADYNLLFSVSWITVAFILVFINNFLVFGVKQIFPDKPLLSVPFVVVPFLLFYLESRGDIHLSQGFYQVFFFICNQPWLILLLLVAMGGSYYSAYFLLKRNSYAEGKKSGIQKSFFEFAFFEGLGQTADLVVLELKMIFRNKRPRSAIFLSIFFMVYFLLQFIRLGEENGVSIQFFMLFFIVSAVSINYGQLVITWDSTFFDSYIANNVRFRSFLNAKYIVIALLTLIPYFFVSVLFWVLNPSMLLPLTAYMLFNTGICSVILLFFSCYRMQKVNLDRGIWFNYEGFGAKDYLVIIPVFAIPVLIYALFYFADYKEYAMHGIGISGLLAIVSKNYLLKGILNILINRKHELALAFRKY
jgi:hypothetical protein